MIIGDCTGALVLIDDVIIHGKIIEEHDHNSRKLMETARTAGLTFNNNKCAINQEQVRFFGAIFDKNSIHPDPQNVEEIKSLTSPTNITELQKVLGIIIYMAPFFPRLSDLTANLRKLLRKDIDNDSHQKSLQEIKDLIYKEMLRHYYDPSKKSVIQVDASSRGLEADFEANAIEGKPIAFASKSLTETEQRFANIERELLAVVFGCERFRTYIYGCAFKV